MAHWSIPLDVLAKKIGQRLEDVVRTSTLLVFGEVLMKSPVDTGRFRANWVCTYGEPAIGYTRETVDKGGGRTLETIERQVNHFPVGGWMWLTNSLPYAEVLEYGGYPNPPKVDTGKTSGGYSTQAPNGMVRIAAREFAANVQTAIERAK